eukprot:TRINITY_DN18526_c0_g1_i1.p1 TRINITY_DN18526_c0_g1~~TRINITY_DN18526_c0_g1_i1.p1  ORF type:complete len:299 (+),score=48.63 TRINITY_DN18526_c0_g1_i1:166-1062(+)
MTLEGLDIGSTTLRIFLAELGSKTFFITSICGAWCAWEGVRSHDGRHLHLILVLVGTYTADVARVLVVKFASNPTAGFGAMDVVCCVVFAILAVRARMQLSVFDTQEASLRLAASAEQAKSSDGDPEQARGSSSFSGWNSAAFSSFSFMSAQPQSQETPSTQYGTADNFKAADGLLSARPSDRAVSTVLSFIFTLSIIFLAQADNKSTMFLIAAGMPNGSVIAGSCMGLLFASMLAVLLGMYCERQLSQQRLLFLVSIILIGLSFISLSQAMLHLNAAAPGEQPSATLALLSYVAQMR